MTVFEDWKVLQFFKWVKINISLGFSENNAFFFQFVNIFMDFNTVFGMAEVWYKKK